MKTKKKLKHIFSLTSLRSKIQFDPIFLSTPRWFPVSGRLWGSIFQKSEEITNTAPQGTHPPETRNKRNFFGPLALLTSILAGKSGCSPLNNSKIKHGVCRAQSARSWARPVRAGLGLLRALRARRTPFRWIVFVIFI